LSVHSTTTILYICITRLTLQFVLATPSTTETSTLSLHDALPIFPRQGGQRRRDPARQRPVPAAVRDRIVRPRRARGDGMRRTGQDRKSTRLNSSHVAISYAVFCLKKKTTTHRLQNIQAQPDTLMR